MNYKTLDSVRLPGPPLSRFWLPFAILCAAVLAVPEACGYSVQVKYSNPWYNTNHPTGNMTNYVATSTAMYGGHVAGNTNATSPSNRDFRLASSSLGQAVPLQPPDGYVGSILLPTTAGWSNAVAHLDTNSLDCAFVDSSGRVIAVYQGNVTVSWVLGGVTNTETYFISGAPAKRPVRLFWTQEPYRGPVVNLSKVFVKIHYTGTVQPPADTSSTNRTPGLWIDEAHNLRATECDGIVLVEYFDIGNTNTQKQIGYELLEVMAPEVIRQNVGIGSRLLPLSSFYGNDGLIAEISKGVPDNAFLHAGDGSVYAIARTTADPWNLEIYWKHESIQDVLWPYELDWYAADWPRDAQLFIRGEGTNGGPAVIIPTDLNPELQAFQEPAGHATLGAQRDFYASGEGYSLLKYSTLEETWFEVIHSVDRGNTNCVARPECTWLIGREILPADSLGLRFKDGENKLVAIPGFQKGPDLTVELELFLEEPITANRNLVSDGEDGAVTDYCWMLHGLSNSLIEASIHVRDRLVATKVSVETINSLERGRWYHIAQVADHSRSNLSLYVDGELAGSVSYRGTLMNTDNPMFIGADELRASAGVMIDEVRIWNEARSQADIRNNMFKSLGEADLTASSLLAYYDFDSDTPSQIVNKAPSGASRDGSPNGPLEYAGVVHAGSSNTAYWAAFPGYIHTPEGDGYNVNLYDYPDTNNPSAKSYVFAVNTNKLEVWWANPARLAGEMPAVVYWPSRVIRYDNVWSPGAPEIVIAGQGTDDTGKLPPDLYGEPSVYVQNDPDTAGFNPNEEHALILGDQVYALRDDLNTEGFSLPFVLVEYTDNTAGHPAMKVFHIVETNAAYDFNYGPFDAGKIIQAPAPLSLLPKCPEIYTDSPDVTWRDKNLDMWAAAAGKDGVSATNIVMRYWYPKQSGFYLPARPGELADGWPLTWLSDPFSPGLPMPVYYEIQWPGNAPTMELVETLVDAKNGLPAIDGQKSVDIVYQQSMLNAPVWTNGWWDSEIVRVTNTYFITFYDSGPPEFDPMPDLEPPDLYELISLTNSFVYHPDYSGSGMGYYYVEQDIYELLVWHWHDTDTNVWWESLKPYQSVVLMDSTRSRGAGLTDLPSGIASELGTDGKHYFPDLPPHLRKRLYFDPTQPAEERLRFKGQYVEETAGESYLLMNVIGGSATDTNSDRYAVFHLPGADESWSNAVMNLATDIIQIRTNTTPFDSLALSAGVGGGVGYVTLAFNNSTNLAGSSDPVSMQIIRVVTNLYRGEVKTIQSDNPLDERVTLRHSGDFAGFEDTYEFEWRYSPPSNEGTVPSGPYENWVFDSRSTGRLYNTIQGPGVKTLSDNYYVMRYRPMNPICPAGTNTWSEWTEPVLVMGWIKRVLNGINPFEQRITDFEHYGVNTLVSMISQAGSRWEGDVPLNLDSVNDHGLIEIYETILDRGRDLSIDGIPPINYGPANDALLLAAGRISDLYMLLGNEAYADSKDPTIGFGTDDGTYGAEASSLFCFMNQTASLLEEELALLRGRDNRYGASTVQVAPYYNRLIWNFTKGITGGEVAYALNYNIRDEEGSIDGFINEDDAASLYPQGHGDAWGHYLTALEGYYGLLSSSNFTWIPRVEGQVVAGQTVTVDYYDERKFAAAAAALARTGGEIVNRLHRYDYSENRDELWARFRDADTNRAWGVEDWACRAGQGALFNWVVGNALLPCQDPDPEHEGIQKIDRTTVPELREVAGCFQRIQTESDNANEGLSPIGLAKGVVPFDIDPALMDRSNPNAKTHFEQIYDRALIALNNAMEVFNHVQGNTQLLRRQADSDHEFEQTVALQEVDALNRLIGIFGYPYSDDIGPGKLYPEDYEGPDLIHYQYVNIYDLMGVAPTNLVVQTFEVPMLDYTGSAGFVTWQTYVSVLSSRVFPLFSNYDGVIKIVKLVQQIVGIGGSILSSIAGDSYWNLLGEEPLGTITTNIPITISFHYDRASGFMVKPPEYTGNRRAQGELQLAYSDFIQSYYRLKQAENSYNMLLENIVYQYDVLKNIMSLEGLKSLVVTLDIMDRQVKIDFAAAIEAWKAGAESVSELAKDSTEAVATTAEAASPGWWGKLGAGILKGFNATVQFFKRVGTTFAALQAKTADQQLQHVSDVRLTADLAGVDAREEKIRMIQELETLIRQQYKSAMDVQLQLEATAQAAERYRKILAEGLRFVDESTAARRRAAEHIQAARYQDMAYRIFRNDALQKYDQAFDLAARYVFLAAKAYDYETCLLGGDSTGTPGSKFLEDIVRTRSLGRVANGLPQLAGSTGEGGLADVMARMNANWGVLKGRLGFNNPDTETSRFSLRTEAFRTLSVTNSDATWQNMLWSCKVDNLYDIPEFAKNCIPFDDMADEEPGLVIPFSTEVQYGKNFFGWDLAGGDNAYDPTHFATKIRSVGIWFSNYNNVAYSGLANTPRVYLVPVGDDLMRSPSDNGGEPRVWQVVDQLLPVPFAITDTDLQTFDWIPMHDTLAGSFAQIRQHPSLRAYHDSGSFVEAECQSSARLIGRSVWNTQWLLIIPAGTLSADRTAALETFINGPNGNDGVKDIRIFFQTYSYSGN